MDERHDRSVINGGFGPRLFMPTIYLKHPRHGTKVAVSELEAQFDESHGWDRYTLGEAPESEPVNELRVQRGRPRRELRNGDDGR